MVWLVPWFIAVEEEMVDAKIEQCQCAAPYPHWRVIYANGTASRPFFCRSGMGMLMALRGIEGQPPSSLRGQIEELPQNEKSLAIDMCYEAHFVGLSLAPTQNQLAWENTPVHVGEEVHQVLCFGRIP